MTYRSDKPIVVPSKLPPLKTHQAILDEIKRKPAKDHIEITQSAGNVFNSRTVYSSDNKLSETEAKKQKRKAIKILLSESDQASRNQIKAIARDAGFEVYVVSSFEQIIRTLAIRPEFGVVMMGISFNPDEVVDTANALKTSYPDVSLVALADFSDMDWVGRLVDQGHIFRCLEKPVKVDALERGLDSAIKRHQMLRKMVDLGDDHYNQSSLEKLKAIFRKIA